MEARKWILKMPKITWKQLQKNIQQNIANMRPNTNKVSVCYYSLLGFLAGEPINYIKSPKVTQIRIIIKVLPHI